MKQIENAGGDGRSVRYRIVIQCYRAPPEKGAQAARDITEAFSQRPWHSHVVCEWDGNDLILTAVNDWDAEGHGLSDEFSDEILANIRGGFDGGFAIAVTTVNAELTTPPPASASATPGWRSPPRSAPH